MKGDYIKYCIIYFDIVSHDLFATYKKYQVKEEQEVFGETEAALRCHICKDTKKEKYTGFYKCQLFKLL